MRLIQRVFVILLVILFSQNLLASGDHRNEAYQVVRTSSGYVRGQRNLTYFANKPYYSFRGIPYAAPPINKLRFKAPVSAKPWTGIKDALTEGNQCLQPKEIFSIYNKIISTPYIYGDEDCLYLNIYTPDTTGNYAVMILIPGGVFSEGPSSFYQPDFLLNDDIILVTFTYRLGPFGFMSLGTDEYSGNMGIEDSLFAIQWINQNIERFGGDKNRITIFGYSASSTIAHLLVVSEASQYLFQRAIIMSGSMLNIYAVNERQNHVPEMFKFAQMTDPSVRTFDDLVEFLQNVDGTYLLKNFIQKISYLWGLPRKKIANYIWSPIVKTPFNDHSKLFENASKIIENKAHKSNIDTLFGYTSKESIYYLSREVQNPSLLKSFNEKYEVQLPLNHDADIRYDSQIYKCIAKKIHDFYFGPGVIVDAKTLAQYVDLTSDMWIRYGVYLSARIQAKSSSGRTFFYEFSVDDHLNIIKKLFNVTIPGASVADDLPNIFRYPVPGFYDNVTSNSVEGRTIRTMTKLWTNFVKYGNPSIRKQILPFTNEHQHFFRITNAGVVTDRYPRAAAMALWDEIYAENYKGFLKTNILNG